MIRLSRFLGRQLELSCRTRAIPKLSSPKPSRPPTPATSLPPSVCCSRPRTCRRPVSVPRIRISPTPTTISASSTRSPASPRMPSSVFAAPTRSRPLHFPLHHPFVATSRKNLEDFCAARGIAVDPPDAGAGTLTARSPSRLRRQFPRQQKTPRPRLRRRRRRQWRPLRSQCRLRGLRKFVRLSPLLLHHVRAQPIDDTGD